MKVQVPGTYSMYVSNSMNGYYTYVVGIRYTCKYKCMNMNVECGVHV